MPGTDGFPMTRQPQVRQLSEEPLGVIEAWFSISELTIGELAHTPEKLGRAKCSLYTWKNCFATSIRNIKQTDLIEHTID